VIPVASPTWWIPRPSSLPLGTAEALSLTITDAAGVATNYPFDTAVQELETVPPLLQLISNYDNAVDVHQTSGADTIREVTRSFDARGQYEPGDGTRPRAGQRRRIRITF
jgi:hypothetical protein